MIRNKPDSVKGMHHKDLKICFCKLAVHSNRDATLPALLHPAMRGRRTLDS